MELEDHWKFFKEVDFTNESILQYNVDTRDFHVGCMKKEDDIKEIDISKIEKYPERFFYTPGEIVQLLNRYFIESGGESDWRFFSLINYGDDWSLKYIRIQRTPHGLVICNSHLRALTREILNTQVNTELL
jgi:hypothetical protein